LLDLFKLAPIDSACSLATVVVLATVLKADITQRLTLGGLTAAPAWMQTIGLTLVQPCHFLYIGYNVWMNWILPFLPLVKLCLVILQPLGTLVTP
jgi:hypothetical protein